jgi:uncharacterized LabA/DUF88 family protein
MPIASSGPSYTLKPLMIFIDGGYLRERVKESTVKKEITHKGFETFIARIRNYVSLPLVFGDLIRVYYYDAIPEENDERRKELKQFFKMINLISPCQVRLGELVKTDNGYRQKGVDILMAVDAVSKAYENHFDIAVILCGDRDFIELIKAIKDAGKRVFGCYSPEHVSDELKQFFDYRIELNNKLLNELVEE